jgi:hypothetical protein
LYIWPSLKTILVIVRLKNRFKRIYGYFLLILFLGYYGSITLFYHSHIVNGDTIVHSHPSRTNSHGVPIHSHTDKGFITVHLLSCFVVSFILVYFNFRTIAPIVNKIVLKTKQGSANHTFYYLYSLRGPPLDILN